MLLYVRLAPFMTAAPQPAQKEVLDSWKEIAVFLKRGIRTVQRWERDEGLPVHRHGHNKRATVIAYTAEIQKWIDSRREDRSPEPQRTSVESYAHLTHAQLMQVCIAARSRAERARRHPDIILDKYRHEMTRLMEVAKRILAA